MVVGRLLKIKNVWTNSKKPGGSIYTYQNEETMAYGDFKDLHRKTFADEVLRDKALNITKDPKYDGYQRGLASIVYKFFEKLHKPIVRMFNKRKLDSPFIDNIWGANIADMQLVTEFNKGFRFLLCVIDIYSKYAWIFLWKV